MIAFLQSFRRNLTPEKEILCNRLIIGTVLGFASLFFAFNAIILSALLAYLSLTASIYIMQSHNIWRQEKRWLAAIILDVMMAFAVMLQEPAHMSIFYPIILLMILGNGFRYGLKFLFVAAFLSTVTFGIVVMSTPYWQQNLSLGVALALALTVIPAYCSTLIRKISHAKEQAEMASKAKSYFLASVSHELRTPLNAIIGYGNHLRQSDMPRGQKEMVEASVLAGEHLLHLIEQLIEVAKTGAGTAQVKHGPFRPTDLLTEIRDIMAVRTEEKGLSFHLQAEPLSDRLINGSSDVVRNILLNLVGNAVKFTESGYILLNSGISSQNGQNSIWFAVTDTGIGIADAAVERIFQPFQQADETVLNRFGGTGLGLSICKQLVEQIGGTISVDSNIGQGSKFRIEIPIDAVSEQIADIETSAGVLTNILSFGEMKPGLLATLQSHDNFIVRHVQCRDTAELEAALNNIDLQSFNVALMSENFAKQIEPDSSVWIRFMDAEIAPVLVSDREDIEIDDLAPRAAFASILPSMPNFAELSSAIRIGCSFSRHFRIPHDDDVAAITIYQPQRVLVADDNRTNRNVLAAILESAGHQVVMVTDGDEALEALEKGGIDILLLDINMPRLNGIDACLMWRQIEGDRQHIPIIGVTADATSETEQKCREAGMDLRITKPVDAKLLLASIEQYCADGRVLTIDACTLTAGDRTKVVTPISGGSKAGSDAIDPEQIDYLMSIGDNAFVHSMIEGFFEDVEQALEPLRRAVDDGDVSEFRFCAHAFKSSGNNMGAKALTELCGQLEKVTELDFSQNRHAYLESIERELERVIEALNAHAASAFAAPMVAHSR
jgi:two-component system, sensor histidine kinase RpfC